MKNELGQEISSKKIRDIARKIRNLGEEGIDEFYYLIGWVDEERHDNKSLPQWRIKKIKEDQKFAEESVRNLLMESDKNQINKNLTKFLRRFKKWPLKKNQLI
ncbi:hypothetical protein HYV50_04765 [Candidatus Pacearchaeota archaeon]|nr:hypothetical protein [Candidatus Pacearchaeota archaeon]